MAAEKRAAPFRLEEPSELAELQADLDVLAAELERLRAAGVSSYEVARLHRRLAAAQAELNALLTRPAPRQPAASV